MLGNYVHKETKAMVNPKINLLLELADAGDLELFGSERL